jgi:hypothetical protein
VCRRLPLPARKPGARRRRGEDGRARALGPGRGPRARRQIVEHEDPAGCQESDDLFVVLRPAAVGEEQVERASAASTSCQSPWSTVAAGSSATARQRQPPVLVELDREERHGRVERRIHASRRRRRRGSGSGTSPRAPASTCNSRPVSALQERTKPVRAASASAFSTSCGVTFLHYFRGRSAPVAPALGSRPRGRGLARGLRGAV